MPKIKGRNQMTIRALKPGVVSILVNIDYSDSLCAHFNSKKIPFQGPFKAAYNKAMQTQVSEFHSEGTLFEAEKWVDDWHPERVIGKWKSVPFEVDKKP